jgi:hypothetical protein
MRIALIAACWLISTGCTKDSGRAQAQESLRVEGQNAPAAAQYADAGLQTTARSAARVQSTSGPVLPANWNAYFGRHFAWKPWTTSLRDPRTSDVAPSGRAAARSTRTATALEGAPGNADVIVMIGLVPRQGRLSAHVQELNADRGATYRARLAGRVQRELDAADPASRIYWQVGNEINTATTSKIVRNAASGPGSGKGGRDDDPAIIPAYVEYFLAPAVAAIDEVSRARFGTAGKIPVILGSVAGARRRGAREWMDELLSYQVKGDYAPSLAGKRVADLVNIVALHYIVSYPGGGWDEHLESVRSRWVGQGRVNAVWSTEEVGRQAGEGNGGAAAALRVASRYLHYWATHRLTPAQGHAFIWGAELGNAGTRSDDFMQLLWDFFGATPLADVSDSISVASGTEAYAFRSVKEPNKLAVMYFNKVGAGGLPGGALSLDATAAATTSRVYFFGPAGMQQVNAPASRRGRGVALQVPAAANTRAALVLIGS